MHRGAIPTFSEVPGSLCALVLPDDSTLSSKPSNFPLRHALRAQDHFHDGEPPSAPGGRQQVGRGRFPEIGPGLTIRCAPGPGA